MANYRHVIPKIQKWEGGFSNDPERDLGGATYRGVTLDTFRQYYGKDKTVDDLKRLQEKQWHYIFKTGYWDKIKGDLINDQSVADILADWVWMSGVFKPVKRIQKILGIPADGIFGTQTLNAVNGTDGKILFGQIKAARQLYYADICAARPANRKNLNGWLNRLNDYKYGD